MLGNAGNKQEVFYKFSQKLIAKTQEELFTGIKDTDEDFYVKYSLFKQLEKDVVDAVLILEESLLDIEDYIEVANEDSRKAVRNTIIMIFLTTIMGIALAVVLYLNLKERITKPIRKLSEATSKIAEGNFDIEVDISEEEDEVSELTQTFNQMVKSLKRVLEENPRLKKFVNITNPKRKTGQDLKYQIDTNTSYILKDPDSNEAYDILLEKANEGFSPLVISRTNPQIIKEKYGISNMILLSEEKDKKVFTTSDINTLQKKVIEFITKNEKPIIVLDRADYVMLKNGFNKLLDLITKINDVVMSKEAIFLLPVDPSIFNNQQLSLLEKELQKGPEHKIKRTVPKGLVNILEFIDNLESLSKDATYKDVGQKFKITAPTTLKRINDLISLRLVTVSKIGRNKIIKLTREGKRVLLNK